jgi:hypothetical protein
MAMGEAVGVAAAMCAAEGVAPRKLNVKKLQNRLTNKGIELYG